MWVFFQAEDGIRDHCVTGVQTCALPISISIKTNLNTDSIKTLKIQVNNQILTLHDSYYNSNIVINLIFFEMLEWQEFEIEKIKRSDDLCLFRITDLEDQVFTANQSDINIYSIQKKILSILTTKSK